MRRRALVGITASAMGLAAPALAQTAPEVRWRLASSFPRSLMPWSGAEFLAQKVAELTDGRFRIQCSAAGEVVPPLQVLDAAAQGSVEVAHTIGLYFIGKDSAFAFAATVPFMLNPRQQNAWLYHGGGNGMLDELFGRFGVVGLPCGNTGNQMGGWFHKEIRSVEDLRGLKFRVAGLAGAVMAKAGVVPQQIAPGDVYAALERGTIDGVEYVGPYDDLRLGLHRVARHYYHPGWGEGGTILHVLVNKERWDALPLAYRAALETAAMAANAWTTARYDAANPEALQRLVAEGAQLRAFPNEVVDALHRATQEVFAEQSAANPRFRALLESQSAFRDRSYGYHQVADYAFDSMMLRLRRQQPH
jgi:TRAP-type mannitol/chloroaromatic compound transport system substrate-binding protein